MEIIRSLILFALAGLAEIGSGWLVWQWLREGKGVNVITESTTRRPSPSPATKS